MERGVLGSRSHCFLFFGLVVSRGFLGEEELVFLPCSIMDGVFCGGARDSGVFVGNVVKYGGDRLPSGLSIYLYSIVYHVILIKDSFRSSLHAL